MLAYWDGYTVDQIASHLDVPVDTVKTRFTAALRLLRVLIRSTEPGPHSERVSGR